MDNILDFNQKLIENQDDNVKKLILSFANTSEVNQSSWADISLAAFLFSQCAFEQYQKETGDTQTYKDAFEGAL